MVGIRLQGRLGNQIFQYAFGVALMEEFNTAFYLDDSQQQNCIGQYFRLRRSAPIYLKIDFTFYLQLSISKLKRESYEVFLNNYIRTKFKEELQGYQVIQQTGFEIPEIWKNNIVDNALYEGFFQSDNYLPPEDLLKKYFKIKPKFIRKFERKYINIFNDFKTVVVHIRRTDYLDLGSDEFGGHDLSLPFSYYQGCLDGIKNIEKHKIFFISDEIDFVKKNIEHKGNYFFESNDEIIDLQLLINADILILSNSSFSWWGAYLNCKKDKIVFAPKYWLGYKVKKEYPTGINVESWIQIEV
jgi:hypothetical protein